MSKGPIVYIRFLNKKIIFLNTIQAATDLLESRSLLYSDRPTSWMATLADRDSSIFRTRFTDPRFKVLRKLLQDGLNSRAARSYRPIQVKETHILLKALADDPSEFRAHVRRYFNPMTFSIVLWLNNCWDIRNAIAVIIRVSYGHEIGGNDDPIVRILEDTFRIAATLSTPGKFWVEGMPFCTSQLCDALHWSLIFVFFA